VAAPEKVKPGIRFSVLYVTMALLAVAYLRDAWVSYNAVSPIPYSEFQQLLQSHSVKDLVVSDDYIRGAFTTPRAGRDQFVTARVEPALARELAASGATFTRAVESRFFRELLSWIVPTLLFVGLWALIARRAARAGGGLPGGLMAIGRSKAKIYVETDTRVRFSDVAGAEEAKDELVEIVSFLKDPTRFSRLGARMPKGVLLVGPPGTGKTLLAKAVAGEAGVPFYSISGSEFVEMFVGVGAARVRDLFEQAREKAPAIIFIDELDALGKARGAGGFASGHDEKEQTLNQLLVELDGFDSSSGLVLLAATNRPEILDPALLRAGRFDRQVLVDRPDKVGRLAILKVHSRKVPLAPELDLGQVAALTPGFTGADLANLVNEAALLATRQGRSAVGLDDFTAAIERIVAGLEKRNRLLNPRERDVVAHHEMGHALVAAALPGSDKIHKVSIIPRGIGSLGYTIQRPTEDRYLMTRSELQVKMAVLMGGRAAEELVFAQDSTGAADDIAKATDIAHEMVTRYGMDPTLGTVNYDEEPVGFLEHPGSARPHRHGTESARLIDEAVRRLVLEARQTASAILRRNLALLKESAARLLAQETLVEEELASIFARLDPTLERADRPSRPFPALAPGPRPSSAPLSP
jgi:cell division protease FtsH